MSNNIVIQPAPNLVLITGGARSGKSRFAEKLAINTGRQVVYLATMEEQETDPEAVERIKRHRARRPEHWQTVEAPLDIHEAIERIPPMSACIVDCLSLYVSNIVLDGFDGVNVYFEAVEARVNGAIQSLTEAVRRNHSVKVFVVTNEVGWGIVPENGLARAYRDLLGTANQCIAAASSQVWLSCAGLQIAMRQESPVSSTDPS